MSTYRDKTFNLSHFKNYLGPNPYLNKGALVFEFAISSANQPLPIEDYHQEILKKIPQLSSHIPNTYEELFAQTVAQVNQLEMELYIESYSVIDHHIAIQCLDYETTLGVINLVWEWWETITHYQDFNFRSRLKELQENFRVSPYGGPTSYALWESAAKKGIPTFYLPEERLMQYGYGKYNLRGVSTTFSCDSHLDSDFTTFKDHCKEFLTRCGFPVPQGKVVYSFKEALDLGDNINISYPLVVKPVVGHKGIGVTANINTEKELKFAYNQAVDASPHHREEIIIEQYIPGRDFRLICVGGKFVAALERRPPFIVGDGKSTIEELIEQENATEARQDTPISPLAKIIVDDVLENYLEQQRLSLNTVLDVDNLVYLRQVSNISSGGVSVDITRTIHPDNIILAQEIAQYFNLICLGIDVIALNLSKSWKQGEFAIIEINAAPGVFMHLKPALGESIDVPGRVLEYLFPPEKPCRMPIITFNHLSEKTIFELVDLILMRRPHWTIGALSHQGMWLNHSGKILRENYNTHVRTLLRHPQLDLLLVEYSGDIFEKEGMMYEGSDMVILENPTKIERILARDLLPNGIFIIKEGCEVSLQQRNKKEVRRLANANDFSDFYLREICQLIFTDKS
jgi:cyanophycin synthetase